MIEQVSESLKQQGEEQVSGCDRVYVEAATTRRRKRRYVKGMGARPLMFIRKWFGDGVVQKGTFLARLVTPRG